MKDGTITVYATQTDADEIPCGLAMYHIRHCVIKSEVTGIAFPCFSFKSNFHWLQTTYDMIKLKTSSQGILFYTYFMMMYNNFFFLLHFTI